MRAEQHDVVVIGGAIAGQTAAWELAQRGFDVVLVEQDMSGRQHGRLGDLMLQVLSRAGELAVRVRQAERYGVLAEFGGVNYSQLVRRRDEVVDYVIGGRPMARLEAAGIRVVAARGRLRASGEVEAGDTLLRGRAVILATGSRPHIPEVPGLEQADFLVPERVLGYYGLPRTMAVLGGGAVGVTFAQVFSRFGVGVTLVERGSRVLEDAEPEVSQAVTQVLQDDGVRVFTGWEGVSIHLAGGQRILDLRQGGNAAAGSVTVDAILVATGRDPAVQDLGLEAAGIQLGPRGVLVDDELRTTASGVWACGDVVGVYHLSHMAEYEARLAAHNVAATLTGQGPPQKVRYAQVPWAYPLDPEVAQVGLREEDARRRGGPVVVGLADFAGLHRAITRGEVRGVVKVVADGEHGRILGVHIVGPRAGELISEASLALRAGLTVHDLAETAHPALALAEALRRAAAAAVQALG